VLDWAIAVCSALLSILLVAPALVYLWPVTQSGPVRSRKQVGNARDWQPWTGHKVSLGEQPVLVFRMEKEFRAFSAVCTHLGCLVDFEGVKGRIFCPCHAGVYNLEGQVVAGPPPKPLPQLEVTVVDDNVYVST
jgi:cytochrome b6-f complex iron-sulfur subunit